MTRTEVAGRQMGFSPRKKRVFGVAHYQQLTTRQNRIFPVAKQHTDGADDADDSDSAASLAAQFATVTAAAALALAW
jgi:hypothetical protein